MSLGLWHVKDPYSVCLAWVLSAKLNPSTGSIVRVPHSREETGRQNYLQLLVSAYTVPHKREIPASRECTRRHYMKRSSWLPIQRIRQLTNRGRQLDDSLIQLSIVAVILVKVTDSWPACREFQLSTAEDLPCQGTMHFKSVEALISCHWRGGEARRGKASSGIVLVT
ncbi:hypothetical protein TNCV_2159851 [Trichonephila clavipes]|nr:hypothetical protein TNCV_2159851 [Trichonephila clavipes]